MLRVAFVRQALAQRARAFTVRICVIRRNVGQSAEDDLAFLDDLRSLPDVLRRADYLAIALPPHGEDEDSSAKRSRCQ